MLLPTKMSSSQVKFSIILRSHNDFNFVQRNLMQLKTQTIQDFELIVCDDNSTDGSYELLADFPNVILVTKNPNEAYVPGKVLNKAVQKASGEIIVFNNSDAVIQNKFWLENLTRPLENLKVAATFANQLPRVDALPLVKKDYERAFGDGSVSKNWFHFFSLASSSARKALLLEYPFDEKLQYSEDIDWSYRMKKLGFEIRYVPTAQVEHSHNYDDATLKKRFFNEGIADSHIFQTKPCFLNFVKSLLIGCLRDFKYLVTTTQISYIFKGLKYRFIQKFSYYQGLKAGNKK